MTATDAAVLCGVYPEVLQEVRRARRKVRVRPRAGLRILLGFAARMGGINDVGIEPIAAHSTLHYLRVFFRVRKGATKAEASVKALGYVTQCNGCNAREWGPAPLERCTGCGTRVRSWPALDGEDRRRRGRGGGPRLHRREGGWKDPRRLWPPSGGSTSSRRSATPPNASAPA